MGQPLEHYFQSSHGEICYFEWGSAGGGPLILLLHATGFHARCWDKLVEAFPDDIHVIAVDQLGHGRSAKPEKLTDWSMVAGATSELLESLGHRFAIGAGHSMGGHCLVQIAALLPEMFDALTLIDPVIMDRAVYYKPPSFSATADAVAKRRNRWTGPQEMFDRFKTRHPYRLWDPAVLHDCCTHGLLRGGESENDGEAAFHLACPPASEAAVYATSVLVDPWPMIETIAVPVTVLRAKQIDQSGGFDFAGSPTLPELADSFARGRDVHLPDLTHFMPMQEPERIADMIMGATKQG